MKAVVMREPGGPEVLEVAERPSPVLESGQVRVRVRSSGINRADLIQRKGGYPPPPGVPADIPGLEFSGIVEAAGPECRLRSVGEPVMGILAGGGYAESVVLPERQTIRVPEGMDPVEAGAIPEVFMTAWDALVNQAGLRSGETVLIHAVGSGVGTAALQLARAMGARTIGTSRTAEKVDEAMGLGLDAGVVASADRDWQEGVLRSSGGRGADVILDLVGGSYVGGNLNVLATQGRWIVVGVPGGRSGEIDLRKLMGKRAVVKGTVLRARAEEEKATLAREFERTVVPLFERGHLHPVMDRAYRPEEAAEAHRQMEANRSFGKLMLVWGD